MARSYSSNSQVTNEKNITILCILHNIVHTFFFLCNISKITQFYVFIYTLLLSRYNNVRFFFKIIKNIFFVVQILRSHFGSFFCASNFKLTKLKRQNVKLMYLGDTKQLVHNKKQIQWKKSSKYAPVVSVQTKSIKTSAEELFSKTTG